jgi:hypothetical protein
MTNDMKRVADALEEILRLVKEDQEATRKRITDQWDNDLDKIEVVKKDENFNYSQLELPFPEVE